MVSLFVFFFFFGSVGSKCVVKSCARTGPNTNFKDIGLKYFYHLFAIFIMYPLLTDVVKNEMWI